MPSWRGAQFKRKELGQLYLYSQDPKMLQVKVVDICAVSVLSLCDNWYSFRYFIKFASGTHRKI
jgi:hypothetical protein